jgi:hypothetical protein
MSRPRERYLGPFQSLLDALKAKDAALFKQLGHLPANKFWREWKKVHPEDFPQGGQSVASAASIMPKLAAA